MIFFVFLALGLIWVYGLTPWVTVALVLGFLAVRDDQRQHRIAWQRHRQALGLDAAVPPPPPERPPLLMPLLPWEPLTAAGRAYREEQLAYRRAHDLPLTDDALMAHDAPPGKPPGPLPAQ